MSVLLRINTKSAKPISSIKCDECGGSGYLHEYDHICAGRCFTCSGTGRLFSKKAKAVWVGHQSAHVLALEEAFQIEHVIAWLAFRNRGFVMRKPGTSTLVFVEEA